MDAKQRYRRAKELLTEAIERPASERARFLEEACGGDAALRAEVESLLAYHEQGAAFLQPDETTSEHLARAAAALHSVPDRIGRYRIVGEIGQGGMGTVYEAEQDTPRRTVALKVLRPGLGSGPELRRFELEAEVLGRLRHPGIAQVYDAGTAEHAGGLRPFLAMERVDGVPVTTYAAERGIGVRERLELVASICDAVEHAHEKGVIHRDLKPGNVLVEANGQPKVLDFGIARVTGQDPHATLRTNPGEIIGTLSYMSPEQAAGDSAEVDTRSDVYALGVIAYELLAGRRPHRVDDCKLHDAVRVITEDEPEPLGKRDPQLRGDISTIVHKALDKEKARRYGSAAALAADIRRFLADQPITSRPTTAMYQLRKFARRHRVLVVAAALVFLSLVSGLIAALHGRAQALEAEQAALGEKAAADLARDEEARQRVAAEVQARRSRRTTRFLQAMLSMAEPERARGRELTVSEVLDATAAQLEGGALEEPELEAAIRFAVGAAYSSLGRYDESERMLERALEIRRTDLVWSSHDTADILNSLGMLRLEQGRFEESLTLLDEALAVQRSAAPDAEMARFSIEENRGNALQELGRFESLVPMLRDLLARRVEMFGDDHEDVAGTKQNLAVVLMNLGRFDEARPLFDDAYEWFVDQRGRLHPDTHSVLMNMVSLRLATGDVARAREQCLEALDIARELFEEDHTARADTLARLADVLLKEADYSEAEDVLRQALRIREEKLGAGSLDVASTLTDLSRALIGLGRPAEAEASLRRALSIQRGHETEAGMDLAWTLQVLAAALLELGRMDESEGLQREAMERCRDLLGDDHPSTLVMMSHLGNVLFAKGDIAGCAQITAQVLEAQVRSLGEAHPNVAKATLNLSVVERESGDLLAAESHARLGLERTQRAFDGDHPVQMAAVRNLARVLRKKGDLDEAAGLFREALSRARKLYGPDDRRLAEAEAALIEVLVEAGGTEEEARRAARAAMP